MPRPKSKNAFINLKFSSLLREDSKSLDSMLVDKLKQMQDSLGSFAVEDLVKCLIRDAFQAGWPDNAVKAHVAVVARERQSLNGIDLGAGDSSMDLNVSDELEIDIPSFLQVSIS